MAVETATLIVGGSAAGLAVARQLQEAGQDALIVEADAEVGHQWRNAYERLHLHTPRSHSGLPHQPMPASYPRYPSRLEVIAYLEDYAGALKRPPRFNHTATAIRRDGGRWVTEAGGGTFIARTLVIATGNTRVPVRPNFAGESAFGGPVLHSSSYWSGADYRGQRVLVVGFGNSAAEIAIDLAEQGAMPTVSVRGGVNVVPREILGIPTASIGLVQRLFSPAVADTINAPIIAATIGDITKLGLKKLPYGPLVEAREHHQIPVLDIGAIALIRAGKIAVRPGIARFAANAAVFTDGRQEPFDAVILGTGFRAGLGDLFGDVPGVLDDAGTPQVSGGESIAPGLYFCGFTVASGGQFRQICIESGEIAARIVAPVGT